MPNTVSKIIPDDTLNRIIQIESAGKPDAKAPTSSAAGLGQFLTATWLDTVRKHRPDLYTSIDKARLTEMRRGKATARLQIEILARFTEDNAKALGQGWTDGDLYLAHFLGMGDARRVFRAPPDARVEGYVTAGAVKANLSILSGKTCGQVRSWAQMSMVNRWFKAGKINWIAKWYGPISVTQPPDVPAVPKTDPTKMPPESKTVGGTLAGGAAATAGAASQGVGPTTIIIMVFATIVIAVGGYFLVRWYRGT